MAAARTTRAFGSVPAFHSAYSARNRRSNRFTRLQIATENSPIRRLQPSAAIVFMKTATIQKIWSARVRVGSVNMGPFS